MVDLCCGNGYFTAPLSKLDNRSVYALDIDPLMLGQAVREVLRHGARVAARGHRENPAAGSCSGFSRGGPRRAAPTASPAAGSR